MKSLYFSLFTVALSGFASAAVTVGAFNYTGSPIGATGTPIVNTDGTPLATNVYFGAFQSGLPDFGGNAADIITAFTQNGPGLANAFAQAGLFNGTIDGATSTDGTDLFNGKEIFMLVGNGASLGASTEVMVFSSGVNWPVEIEGVGAVVNNIELGFGNLERGVAVEVDGAAAPFDVWNGTTGMTFGVVPEPSVALLGALGFFGLLRRRR